MGNLTAFACIRGENIRGIVRFRQEKDGCTVSAEIYGLPNGFHGFHIHEGRSCGGEDFSDTKSHFDPTHQPHPDHAGDLPPLLSCRGKAILCVRTDRFAVRDVIGRTVVIHSQPDDFKTQPAGNSGRKIACGRIITC